MKTELRKAMQTLNGFIGRDQLIVVGAGMRGEERQFFADKMLELAALIESMPVTYQGRGDAAMIHLHYFTPGADAWIVEKDCDNDGAGQIQAYGWASINGERPELGYISIAEWLRNGAELDFHYRPRTVAAWRESLEKAGRL